MQPFDILSVATLSLLFLFFLSTVRPTCGEFVFIDSVTVDENTLPANDHSVSGGIPGSLLKFEGYVKKSESDPNIGSEPTDNQLE